MKKSIFATSLILIAALFIYVFYRTENTVVNKFIMIFIEYEKYYSWKAKISSQIPLPDLVVYSLPEGLWIFSVTLFSLNYFIALGRLKVSIHFFPITYAILLEIIQWTQLINGTFDFWDILISTFFWFLAIQFRSQSSESRNLFEKIDFTFSVCIFNYLIVYLSHVWK